MSPERLDQLRDLLASGRGHAHALGLCGVGMAGVAWLLKQRGFTVSGCDLKLNPLADWLAGAGISARAPHDPAHMAEDVDWVIRSAAVPPDAPECQAARARGLPVFTRGEVLPRLLDGRRGAIVCGTHGKTSTSTFLACLLRAAGLRTGWCIGGESPLLGGVAGGTDDDLLVAEADESDGTLALYTPALAIVTNIEFDHMEHFASVADFEACFATVMARARRLLVCLDDPRAARLAAAHPDAIGYGTDPAAAWRAEAIVPADDGSSFTIVHAGRRWRAHLPLPGEHNVLNSLAAFAAAVELGADPDRLVPALAQLGLPRRRLEQVVARPDLTVISDYAHHPTEVRRVLEALARRPAARRRAVFQPHRYTRTRALGGDFPAAFAGLDELVLTPVYAASEPPLPGGTVWDLYSHFYTSPGALDPARVRVAESPERAWAHLRATTAPGDLLLVLGAGDIESLARAAARTWDDPAAPLGAPARAAAWADALRPLLPASTLAPGRPLAPLTTYGVGGPAELFVGIGDEADLARLLAWRTAQNVPLRMLGAGSNVLAGDLGVPGLVCRLEGACFRACRIEGDRVVAGAALPLGRLLDQLEAAGLAGLEALEGVPGLLGGALRMNAGAYGVCMADAVEWIRCLKNDGRSCRIGRDSFGAGYRGMIGLADDDVIVEAGFRLRPGDAARLAATRAECRTKRAWMNGLRTAGSVFKNPDGAAGGLTAGRRLDACGVKGWRIGGAWVTERHANVIAAGPGARAQDIRALIERMRAAVAERDGCRLEPEVRIWPES